jgi:hypothetical protein
MAMVKIGVSEFNMPARELSIFVSAIQNRKAGKKVPKNPDKIMGPNIFLGISLIAFPRNGINTIPALRILNDAT